MYTIYLPTHELVMNNDSEISIYCGFGVFVKKKMISIEIDCGLNLYGNIRKPHTS